MKRKPLEVTFLNKPNPERIFRAWADAECAKRGVRLASIEIKKMEKDARIA